LIISMQDGENLSLEQIRAFLESSQEVHLEGQRRKMYEWIPRLLRQPGYRTQGKVVRGLLGRYVAKMSGRSRAQVTRRVGRYLEHSEAKESSHRRPVQYAVNPQTSPINVRLLQFLNEKVLAIRRPDLPR
jgi:hypothetical protein